MKPESILFKKEMIAGQFHDDGTSSAGDVIFT